LAGDAPDAAPNAGNVVFGQEFRAVEGRVLLLEYELLQVSAAARVLPLAAVEGNVAGAPGQILEDKPAEVRV
jgi:hypothetical protein